MMAGDIQQSRLASLDAARGFDMFFIMGGEGLVVSIAALLGFPEFHASFGHVPWDGLNFMDTVFPTFLFLAGVTFPFSAAKSRERGATDLQIGLKALRRCALLILLGLIHDGPLLRFDFAHLRINSVLGRVGFGWAAAAATLLYYKRIRTVVWWCIGIFAAYTLLSWLIPTLAGSANPWMPREAAAPHIIDEWLTPGRTVGKVLANGKANGHEGFFSAFGCIPTAFLGMFCGLMLKYNEWSPAKKSAMLAAFAAALGMAGGVALLLGCPCVKPSWNPTYILVAGAISTAFLALFHWIIDVKGFTKWCFVFQVIGMNSITIYMFRRLFDLKYTSRRFLLGVSNMVPEQWHDPVITAGTVVIGWLFVYYLYRKKIFLRV